MLHGETNEWCHNITRRLSKFIQRRGSFFAFLTILLLIGIFTVVNYKLHFIFANSERKLPSAVGCYFETKDNVLVSVDDIDPPENSIFFHETSCSGGLNSRQACSVEAAAKLHPNRTVYVLFNSPVTRHTLKSSSLSKLQMPNIRLARLDIRTYGRGTPLADVLVEAQYSERSWMMAHTSDLLRYTTLYKYGGVYLDLDTLLVKNLDVLGANWACREDHTSVSAGIISFSKHGIGRKMAEITVNDLKWNFQPWDWANNGPGTISRALLSICAAELEIVPSHTGGISCQGFTVYNPAYFYPVHYKHCEVYFRSNRSYRESPGVYGHHVCYSLTMDMPVMPDSPFDMLAKKYCPIVRAMYGDTFGS